MCTAIMAAAGSELLVKRLEKAQELMLRCTILEEKRLEGAHKLKKKLKAEQNFLKSVSFC